MKQKLLCYRCYHPWANGEGDMKRHHKLKDKIEVCPKCGCMWRWNDERHGRTNPESNGS